jgi:twitching motility protein PilT
MKNPQDHLFGQIAVALGLLDKANLQKAMAAQRRRPQAPLGRICELLGLLTEEQVERVLKEQNRILRDRRGSAVAKKPTKAASDQRSHATQAPPRAPKVPPRAPPMAPAAQPPTPSSDRHGDLFGRLAVDSGLVNMDQLAEATREQSRSGKKLGEVLVDRGYATSPEIEALLDTQAALRERNEERKSQEISVDLERELEELKVAQSGQPGERPRAGNSPSSMAETQDLTSAVHSAQLDSVEIVSMSAELDTPKVENDSRSRPAPQQDDAALKKVPTRAPPKAPKAPPKAPRAPARAPAKAPPIAAAAPAAAAGSAQLEALLEKAVSIGASDVHLHAGAPVKVRRCRDLDNLTQKPLADEQVRAVIYAALLDDQRKRLDALGEVDLAYTVEGIGRFRVNVYEDHRGLNGVYHYIPAAPPTLDQLGLPAGLAKVLNHHQGLVLVTGPAGSGKTSTLAALVNLINEERSDHVLTVEDPVEYLHPSKRCVVNQRQVNRDTSSFGRALRAALREDPDVICIGELRDLETISLALSAAETGHLVLGTMHNNSAIRAINSVSGAFPPDQQQQVRTMLSESLRAVVAQRLVPRSDQRGMTLALELLYVNRAVGSLIRENRTFQITSAMQTGRSHGMQLLDQSLGDLVKAGVISRDVARVEADKPELFS